MLNASLFAVGVKESNKQRPTMADTDNKVKRFITREERTRRSHKPAVGGYEETMKRRKHGDMDANGHRRGHSAARSEQEEIKEHVSRYCAHTC